MEKTTQITIGGMTFSLTDAAYAKLSAYLERLKSHFAGEPESIEIMRDIESRIAEKLAERKDALITENDVTALIAEIGEADEFGDEEEESPRHTRAPKKLYRNMDDAWLGGVASGIGAYFDIDPIWIRLIFLVSIFFGGTGVLLYIILWILIPEAKNAGQKLEMRGRRADLEGIVRTVKENVEDVRKSGVIRRIFLTVARIVSGFFRIVGRIAGALLVVGSFFAMIGLVVGTAIVATNWNAPYNDFPLRGVVSDTLLFAGLIAGALSALIPLTVLFALGMRLIRKRLVIPSSIAIGLAVLWALAISTTGTIAVKAAGEFFEYQRSAPEYQTETRELDLQSFTKVNTQGERVVIKHGDIQKITLSGRRLDMERAMIRVENGVLYITQKDEYGKICIFCSEGAPEIIIETPDLEAVYAQNATLFFDGYTDDALVVELNDSFARGDLTVEEMSLEADSASVHFDVTGNGMKLTAKNTHIELEGAAENAEISLENSSLRAPRYMIKTASISSSGSYGEMNAKELQSNEGTSHIINVASKQ